MILKNFLLLPASRIFFAFLAVFCLLTTGYGETENKFSQSLNKFTVDWLKVLSKSNQEKNVLISPVAVGSALGIVHLGTKGNTYSQLEKSLHLTADEAKHGYRTLTEKLKSETVKSRAELEWGSGGWVANKYDLNEEFKKNVLENYRAEINTDFPDEKIAAAHLNEEISNITKGVIKDLFTDDQIKEAVALFYSAIYFKSRWNSPFARYKTNKDKFYVTADNTIDDVEFMDQSLDTKAGECPHVGAKWVQLRYRDPSYFMLFVLPTERHGLNSVIEKITDADLQRMISTNETQEARLIIPKFSLSHKASAVESLKELGVNDIFTNNADLSGISSTGPLKVSDIVQQVNVDVDEDGTRAAAAAGISIMPGSALLPKDPPLVFKADEPFLFFIVYKTDKIPLFVGKVVKPKA